MPLNLLKKYPELLELAHLSEFDRILSLKGIFKRDIEDNHSFSFRRKKIWPVKGEEPSMQILFRHLTTEEIDEKDENEKVYQRRIFEMDRSMRLHWIKPHVDEAINDEIKVFSTEERIHGKNTFRTYVYNRKHKYVLVMEPQRSGNDYYLLSAYYLNRPYGEKIIEKKMKNRLAQLL